ncbi:cytochrome P450 family protein [Kitasatospora acidiphila]|uniref:cytochrome P450 family protein n=1 Tax=Kitasatospora acidiphila TaxID=2567942 RepID=UPI003C738CC7
MPVEPQLVDESFFGRQHEAYREFREQGGARPIRFGGPVRIEGWLVTGHADCRAALADPRLSKDSAAQRYGELIGLTEGPGESLMRHMLNSDPPHHTRLRKLVQKAYTMRRVAALRPLIEGHVDRLLDELAGQDEADLIADFALPLPVSVVFDLFGAPQDEHEALQIRGNSIPESGGGDGEVSVMTAESMLEYIQALIRHKREHPADDLLSGLLAARDGEDRLTEEEITSMAFLLVVAGHQTTVNLIANGVYTLLTHPEQLAALRADPSLMAGAVEEVLRYESSFAIASMRYTTEPVVIAGTEIPAGEFVQIGLLAANRDPAVFPDPDRFDITRDSSRHLAFGHGIHHCLGVPLARLQAEVAFTRILDRYPKLRLALPAEELEWQYNPRHRGLLELPVLLR